MSTQRRQRLPPAPNAEAQDARALIEAGHIGEIKVFQGDFGFAGMGQSPEDMAAKRAIHNPSMSCYVAQTIPLAFN